MSKIGLTFVCNVTQSYKKNINSQIIRLMITKGVLNISYKLSVTKGANEYLALLKLQNPNKTWRTQEFLIRETVEEILTFFKEHYNITIENRNLKKINESRYQIEAN